MAALPGPGRQGQPAPTALAKLLALSQARIVSLGAGLKAMLASSLFWMCLTVFLALVVLLLRLTSPAVVIEADNISIAN